MGGGGEGEDDVAMVRVIILLLLPYLARRTADVVVTANRECRRACIFVAKGTDLTTTAIEIMMRDAGFSFFGSSKVLYAAIRVGQDGIVAI